MVVIFAISNGLYFGRVGSQVSNRHVSRQVSHQASRQASLQLYPRHSLQAGRQASRQLSLHASRQHSRQASRQASPQAIPRARCVPRDMLEAHLTAYAVVMLALEARTALSALHPALRVALATAPRARALREPVQRRARCVPRATQETHLMAQAVVMLAFKARTALSALHPALRVALATAPRARALREPVQRRARSVLRATAALLLSVLPDVVRVSMARTDPPQQATATRALRVARATAHRAAPHREQALRRAQSVHATMKAP